MTIDAELVILPEIDRGALREMQRALERAFDSAARDVRSRLARDIEDGARTGARAGADHITDEIGRMGDGVGASGAAMSGAKFATTSLIALGFAGLFKNIDDASKADDILRALLSESTARTQIATAKSAKISTGSFAGLSDFFKREGGITEQQDINDIVWDLNAQTEISSADGQGVLYNFKDYEGEERLARIFASFQSLDHNKRLISLDELGFGGEIGQQISSALDSAFESLVKEGIKSGKYQNEIDVTNADRYQFFKREMIKGSGAALENEAQKATVFQKASRMQDKATHESIISGISSNELSVHFKERQRELNSSIMLLDRYEKAMIDSTAARATLDISLDTLAKSTSGLLSGLNDIQGTFKEFADNVNVFIGTLKSKFDL